MYSSRGGAIGGEGGGVDVELASNQAGKRGGLHKSSSSAAF